MTDVVVLAHAGGIPEIATVVVPLLLFGAIVYAGKRAERREKEAAPDEGDADD